MKPTSEKDRIELKKRLARVLRVPSNKTCADCPETRPTWISFIKPQQQFALGSKVLASFVCLECAGLHRKLGTHICVVRSISHDQFEENDVECAEYSGNEVVNEIFEGHLQKSTMDGINIKPSLGAEVSRRERFIRQKYVDLYFYRKRAHYQHISEVKKLIPLKSSAGSKPSPTAPLRKKLRMFLNEDNSLNDTTLGCSTTVGNTTNTSRTRTITERDDSNRSETPIKLIGKPLKKRSSSKGSRSKGSKSKGNKSKGRRKSQKKSLSQRRLQLDNQTDPMFGMPSNEGGASQVGEMRKQPSLRNLKEPAHIELNDTQNNNNSNRERNDLSGMILVFDEDSYDSIESPKQERRSSKDLARYRRSGTTSVPNKKKPTIYAHSIQKSAPGRRKPTIDSQQMQYGFLDEFDRKPPIKTSSEVCDNKEPPATSWVRRSRSEITIDEITRKREGSLSPGYVGKKSVKPQLNNNNDSDLLKAGQHNAMQASTPLITHLSRDTRDTSARNLKIPYLEPSPLSPTSVEGFISEESYGFGDHTVTNMSGTGENKALHNTEDESTINGFKVIEPESASEASGYERPDSVGSFTKKFRKKRETDVLIKQQSRRSLTNRSTRSGDADSSDEFNEINTSKKNIFEKAFMSLSNRSNMSGFIHKSITSLSSRSKLSVVSDEEPKQLRQQSQEHIECETPVSTKKKKKKKKKSSSRNLSSKSNTSLSVDEPSKLRKKLRRKSQDQIDCVTPVSTKKKKKKKSSRTLGSKKSSRTLSGKSHTSLSVDTPVKRKQTKSNKSLKVDETPKRGKKSRRPKSQETMDCDSPQSQKKKSPKKRIKRKSSTSRSKSRSKDEEMNLRNRALLDEWERLRAENQREFEKLRKENQRKFAAFDNLFSQHIRL
mmetsp:Transcript_8465/g.20815  ORF Transcript_8465/g.20815 Transcript_8465/m.20815 type:complete len:886 (+) Transcript_8465:345-3002(+)